MFRLPAIALVIVALAAGLFPARAGAGTVRSTFQLAVKSAACVKGDHVLLGEIAEPVGSLPPAQWEQLAAKELWPSPPAGGRPAVMRRDVLEAALIQKLGDMGRLCILPNELALQRGGAVYLESDLSSLIVKTLTPMAQALGGELDFRDYKLPDYLFVARDYHRVSVELVSDLAPGRVSLKLLELTPTNETVRSVSASVFMDLWVGVPAAARPLNRGEVLTPDLVTHVRKNAAYLREAVWDGRGGPWRIRSAVGQQQVIYENSLEVLPVIARGDTVQLVFQGRNIRLEVSAEALADGGVGESIPVRNLQSQRQVLARVLNADTVQVQ